MNTYFLPQLPARCKFPGSRSTRSRPQETARDNAQTRTTLRFQPLSQVDACWFRACILRTTSKAAAKARPGRFRTTDQPPRSRPAGKKGRRKPTSQSESGFISESEPQVKLYRNLRRAHSFAGECFAVPFVRPGRLGDEAPAETGIPTESRANARL